MLEPGRRLVENLRTNFVPRSEYRKSGIMVKGLLLEHLKDVKPKSRKVKSRPPNFCRRASHLPELYSLSFQQLKTSQHRTSGSFRHSNPLYIHSRKGKRILPMATRRIATNEKTHLDQDEIKSEPVSNISPAVPSLVSPVFNSAEYIH